MQNSNSFDLKRAIKDWVASSPALRGEKVDELESHLRDSISRLQAGGLSEEEAWGIAQKRIGHIDSLEQEFVKLAESSTPAPARRSAQLVRSFAAVGTGVIVTMLLSYVAEWSAFQSFFDGSYSHPDAPERVVQEWSTSAQLSLLGCLAGALVGGYITALIARHHPMKHALTAGGLLWCCMTVLRGPQVETWLLWGLIGAALTSAMLLGAMLCERHRPRWRVSMLTDGDYRRLSRRAGVLSVWCMIGAIVAGLAERFTSNSTSDSLHALMNWLILVALAAAVLALAFATIHKAKKRKTARLV